LEKNEQQIEGNIIVAINGSDEFKAFLLAHNITIGSVFSLNYSPSFSSLVNMTIMGKMLSLRKTEFQKIEWVKAK